MVKWRQRLHASPYSNGELSMVHGDIFPVSSSLTFSVKLGPQNKLELAVQGSENKGVTVEGPQDPEGV